MKLFYLSTSRIPSEKANTYQVLQMCDAFAEHGVEVELVYPWRDNTPEMAAVDDMWRYYGLQERFTLTTLPTCDILHRTERLLSRFPPVLFRVGQRGAFNLLMGTYRRSVLKYLRDHTADVYYLRDWRTVRALVQARPDLAMRFVYEAHTFPGAGIDRRKMRTILSQIGGIVTITHHLKALYNQVGISPEKILVAPDGVDLHRFSDLPEKQEARQLHGIPEEGILIGYTGHLYPWKGIDTLVRSITYLPPEHQICIVGGMPNDIASLNTIIQRENLSRVKLVGYISPSQVPHYMAAADVLVLPNSSRYDIGRHYTSPLKLFEYMAATRPIIASDLPSAREILCDGHNAHLVPPDNPRALAEGILWLSTHPDAAQAMAKQARLDVEQYTWPKRAQKVLAFLGECSQSHPPRESR
jgi:glycosyltransferase involved in cell wall biosynthesis